MSSHDFELFLFQRASEIINRTPRSDLINKAALLMARQGKGEFVFMGYSSSYTVWLYCGRVVTVGSDLL